MSRDKLSSSSPRALAWALALCSPSFACTSDEVSADSGADEADESGESGEESGGEEEEQLVIGPPAVGIDIVEVEANQGTGVAISAGAAWIPADERNAYLVRNRDTLLRVQYSVAEGWEPREIIAQLHLETPDGERLEPRVQALTVEADSDPRKLATSFYFPIYADEALPGTKYWIELRESGEEAGPASLAEGVNASPADFAEIGYESTTLEMKVMLVPIDYTYLAEPTSVDLSEDDLALFEAELLQQNPLQSVEFTVHEPIEYDTQLTNLGTLLGVMSALRSEEQAEANVYYHALLNIRAPALSHVAGIAQLNDASKEAALGRVAATVYYKYEEDAPAGGSARTFVHEVGHNQGLRHVYCPNAATEAAGTDPAYPHDGGKIGVYGFGIRSAQLYSPTGSHDYMTYCANSWVSDWTWNKTFARIETLTSWDYEGAAEGEAAAEVPLLWGLISPDGSEQWMSFRGPAPHPEQLSAKQRILASDGQGGQRESLAVVSPLSDDASEVIIAPLELDLDEIDALTRVDWRGEQHAIDLARVERRDRALSAAR